MGGEGKQGQAEGDGDGRWWALGSGRPRRAPLRLWLRGESETARGGAPEVGWWTGLEPAGGVVDVGTAGREGSLEEAKPDRRTR